MHCLFNIMMTEEHIKEALSLRYIELIAAFNGFNTSVPEKDYGEDLHIIEVEYNEKRKRFINSGRTLKIQLKATTENLISFDNNFLKYDLDAKNYNDLIDRSKDCHPLLLILFILPSKKNDWLKISDTELIAKKCAYWYLPKETDNITNNLSTKRILISKTNLISNETLVHLFEKFS